MQIGPTRSEVVEKYFKVFAEFPFKTKCKILLHTAVHIIRTQVLRFLYRIKLLKYSPVDGSIEDDLTKYAYRNSMGGHYLSEDEIAEFSENGFIKPFKVLERDKALKLNDLIREKVRGGNIVYGVFPDMDSEERAKKVAKLGLRDDLEARGWNRHFNIPEILDTLSRDEITHRLASLFGRDVYLWRSQLFPVSPGAKGTALHQITDMRLAMNKTVLSPDKGVPKSLINISVWLALNDVDETNAAMILLKGSHKNNKFEQYSGSPKHLINCTKLRDLLLMLFIRNISNDGHARFDLMNLIIDSIEKFDKDAINRANATTLRMKAGEAIIFTSRTIHGSHGNQTDCERLALGGRYTSSAVNVYPDEGEYREIGHFRPHEPVLLDKYKKTFKVCSIEEQEDIRYAVNQS